MLLIFFFSLMGLCVQAQLKTPDFRLNAWKGDSAAMVQLGEAFQFGRGVEKQEDSASIYISKAAEMGHPDAMYLVGTKCLIEVFSPTQYAKGLSFLRKAAEKGHAESQYRLSEVFSIRGKNNQTDNYYDLKKAYRYAESAALQGHKQALLFCAEARLTGSGTTQNDSIAVAYFKQISDKGYILGVIRMGDMLWEGKVTGKVEPMLALEEYKRVFSLGYANIDQKGRADFGIHRIDQFFKQIQNTYMDGNPAMPAGLFDYRLQE